MIELKSCPFCGGTMQGYYLHSNGYEAGVIYHEPTCFFVGTFADTRQSIGEGDASAWNTRTEPQRGDSSDDGEQMGLVALVKSLRAENDVLRGQNEHWKGEVRRLQDELGNLSALCGFAPIDTRSTRGNA